MTALPKPQSSTTMMAVSTTSGDEDDDRVVDDLGRVGQATLLSSARTSRSELPQGLVRSPWCGRAGGGRDWRFRRVGLRRRRRSALALHHALGLTVHGH